VLHAGADEERGVASGHAGTAREADGIVEQRLVAADQGEERRQAGEVGEHRRGQGLARVGAVRAPAGHLEEAFPGALDVGRRTARHAVAAAGEIGPGGEGHDPGRQRQARGRARR
jgi:hypothetical protein